MASVAESNACLSELLDSIGVFLDCLHFPIAIINVEGRYIYYNHESAQLDGCSQEFALGNLLLNVYPTMEPENSTQLESLYTGKCFSSHEQNYFNARGKLLEYMHTTTPLYNRDGLIIGAIEIGWDTSQLTKLQNQILSLTKKLVSSKSIDATAATGRSEPVIITCSPNMKSILNQARRFGATNVPVVIFGESGTGKELIAELVYRSSPRKDKPFVTLNCGALPESLIDSSLFGTTKGAYTGADNSPGYLEFADGGTLFLDEFNSIPMAMQVKLLRFLQTKTFNRVGSPKSMRSDVRIIVAMNEHPQHLIAQNLLRADLYWRLCVAEIEIPPLRERKEDIPLLVNHFIEKHQADIPHRINGITADALELLMKQDWPGNVRMLENTVLRSMAMQEHSGSLSKIDDGFYQACRPPIAAAEGRQKSLPIADSKSTSVSTKNFLESSPADNSSVSFSEQLKTFEEKLIASAIEQTNGNVSAASKLLNMNRTTLNYKLKKMKFVRKGTLNPDA